MGRKNNNKTPREYNQSPVRKAIFAIPDWIIDTVTLEENWKVCTLASTHTDIRRKIIVPIEFICFYLGKLGIAQQLEEGNVRDFVGNIVQLEDYHFTVVSESDDNRDVVIQCNQCLCFIRCKAEDLIFEQYQ